MDVHHKSGVPRSCSGMDQNLTSAADPNCVRPIIQARVDETYVQVKGKWKYLDRAVDSDGSTLDFLLTAKRDAEAAKRFFRKTLNALHTQEHSVINEG